MLQFNHKGFLTPNGIITSDLFELKSNFVDGILSETRKELFEQYLFYSESLKHGCGYSYLQWINGSYCTRKKEPADIDLVSFIPYTLIDANEKLFKQFSHPNSEIEYGVDAYIVRVYPENSRLYPQYISDRLYWLAKFSRTKLNRAGNRDSKGFLEIIF